MRIQVISTQKPTYVYRDYFNIRFLDIERKNDGVYLHPGSYWTFRLPVSRNQLPEVVDPSDIEAGEAAEMEENCSIAAAPPSRDISPVISPPRHESPLEVNNPDPLLSFNPVWESSGALQVDPNCALVPKRVYSLPAGLANV